ncbi:MAG: menaquinone biosynthesis protein, partial [Firmicutes bacterium]|nr:menaquinone biosynthesis protein [Bacillota bacterium]
MARLRIGRLEVLGCLPIFLPLARGAVPLEAEYVPGVPAELDALLLAGGLDAAPVSAIEYARHHAHLWLLPGVSLSEEGRGGSVLFFSRLPVTELDGRTVAVSPASATGTALLQVLFANYYHVDARLTVMPPDLDAMLAAADGALITGDLALLVREELRDRGSDLQVTDLGEVWKAFTGEKMVYAVWAVRRDFAREHPQAVAELAAALEKAREIGWSAREELLEEASRRLSLP